MTTIHELQQALWVTTALGDGLVVTMIDYGPHENCVFLVMLESGRFKHFTTEQCCACRNDTFGISVPQAPKEPARVIATRAIAVLCLIGRQGSLLGCDAEGTASVLFDGDEKPYQCKLEELAFIDPDQ